MKWELKWKILLLLPPQLKPKFPLPTQFSIYFLSFSSIEKLYLRPTLLLHIHLSLSSQLKLKRDWKVLINKFREIASFQCLKLEQKTFSCRIASSIMPTTFWMNNLFSCSDKKLIIISFIIISENSMQILRYWWWRWWRSF